MSLIRFPCMELTEFANGAAQSGLLSLQETTDLFLYFTAFNKPSVHYPTKQRKGLAKQICHRYDCERRELLSQSYGTPKQRNKILNIGFRTILYETFPFSILN